MSPPTHQFDCVLRFFLKAYVLHHTNLDKNCYLVGGVMTPPYEKMLL